MPPQGGYPHPGGYPPQPGYSGPPPQGPGYPSQPVPPQGGVPPVGPPPAQGVGFPPQGPGYPPAGPGPGPQGPGGWPPQQPPGGPGQPPPPPGGGRSPAGLWLGAAALVVAIAGAALACIDATALAGWIVAGVGLALGLALLFWPKTPRVLSGAAAVIAAAGLTAGLILHFTVYDDGDDDSDAGRSASTQSGSSLRSGPDTDPSGSARPDRPRSTPSSSSAAPSSTPRRGRSSSTADGSSDAPFPFGTAERIGDWEVTVFEPYEGWDEIRAVSPHATPPDSDIEFWLFPIEATNLGVEPTDVWMALTAGFEDDAGQRYGGFCAGTIPEDLYDYDEVEPGETVSGNLCVEKPARASGLWTLDADFLEGYYFD